MAKARMLHKKISVSAQVNSLSLGAKLLFTWLVPHADDEGRIKGSPECVKAIAVPMTTWSFKKIGDYLQEIKDAGLIYYWEQGSEWFIEFIKWKEHQTIRKDRFQPSILPAYPRKDDRTSNQTATVGHPTDSQETPQSNISESNSIKSNTSEDNRDKEIADNNFSENKLQLVHPKKFLPSNEVETAAFDAWKTLEPYNPVVLTTTYLKACKQGLPARLFYQFTSEIRQDASINNKGAVFVSKVKKWLAETENT